jgi:hypothetical protein
LLALAYKEKMQVLPTRLIAIDWSGALSLAEQRRRIVAADWDNGNLTLASGRTREETTAWLIDQSHRTPAMVVGLDFSFSLPAWFVKDLGAASIEKFWQIGAANAEHWLANCAAPFWGRPGRACPTDHRAPSWRGYRRCELPENIKGSPKSTFQVGGAGAVGTGSLRGLPTLIALRQAGFSVWPFHPPVLPCVVEIYPRSFTGVVNKGSREARAAYLQRHLPAITSGSLLQTAADSEDAFDALCSVTGMVRQREEFASLQQARDAVERIEGAIFPGRSLQV